MMDRIEQLEAQVAALKEALVPLASLYHKRLDSLDDSAPLYQHCGGVLRVGDIRRACAALATDVGRPLLERLRRAEAERDEAVAALEATNRAFQLALGNVPREEW